MTCSEPAHNASRPAVLEVLHSVKVICRCAIDCVTWLCMAGGAGGEARLDMQRPVPAELSLMREPVQAMRAGLLARLEEFPDNAVLLSPLAICDRLLGLAPSLFRSLLPRKYTPPFFPSFLLFFRSFFLSPPFASVPHPPIASTHSTKRPSHLWARDHQNAPQCLQHRSGNALQSESFELLFLCTNSHIKFDGAGPSCPAFQTPSPARVIWDRFWFSLRPKTRMMS